VKHGSPKRYLCAQINTWLLKVAFSGSHPLFTVVVGSVICSPLTYWKWTPGSHGWEALSMIIGPSYVWKETYSYKTGTQLWTWQQSRSIYHDVILLDENCHHIQIAILLHSRANYTKMTEWIILFFGTRLCSTRLHYIRMEIILIYWSPSRSP